jgi:hypothetical protein
MARSISKGKNKKSRITGEDRPSSGGGSQDSVPAGGSPEFQPSPDREPSSHGSTNGEKDEGNLHRRIAERAFLLYEASGFRHGNDLEHWLEAERQVKTLGV